MSFLIYQINVNIVNIFVILECKFFLLFIIIVFVHSVGIFPRGLRKKWKTNK